MLARIEGKDRSGRASFQASPSLQAPRAPLHLKGLPVVVGLRLPGSPRGNGCPSHWTNEKRLPGAVSPEEGGCPAPQHKPQRELLCLGPGWVECSPSQFCFYPAVPLLSPSSRRKLCLVWGQGTETASCFLLKYLEFWKSVSWFHAKTGSLRPWSLWSGRLDGEEGASQHPSRDSLRPRTGLAGWVRVTHWSVLKNDPRVKQLKGPNDQMQYVHLVWILT